MNIQGSKRERNIRSIHRALYVPLMIQGWDLTLWGSALLSLESIGMFFIAQNAKTEQQVLHLSDNKMMNGESKSSFKLSNKLDNQIALYMRTFNDELTTI